MNEAILAMYEKPGKYWISTVQAKGKVGFICEVDEKGYAHQLTPKLERDGILSRLKWRPDVIVAPLTEGQARQICCLPDPE